MVSKQLRSPSSNAFKALPTESEDLDLMGINYINKIGTRNICWKKTLHLSKQELFKTKILSRRTKS